MLVTVATLPAISPTLFTVGINFLVNQLLGSGEGAEAEVEVLCAVLLKFNKWVGAEEVEVVCARTRLGKAAVLERE